MALLFRLRTGSGGTTVDSLKLFKKSVCISDPAYDSGKYESGVITIDNIKKGK